MSEDERVNWTPIVVGDNYEDGKDIGPSFIMQTYKQNGT